VRAWPLLLLALLLLPAASACTYPHAQGYPLRVVVRDEGGKVLLDADTGVLERSPSCSNPVRAPPPFDGRFVGWRTPDGWRVHDTVSGQQRSLVRDGVLVDIVAGNLVWNLGGETRLEPAMGGNATVLAPPAAWWHVAGGMAVRFEYRDHDQPDSVSRAWVMDLATLESVAEAIPLRERPASPVASRDWLAYLGSRGRQPDGIEAVRLPSMEVTSLNLTGTPIALVGDRLFFTVTLGYAGAPTHEEVRSVLLPSGDGVREDADPRGVVDRRRAEYVLDTSRPATTLDATQSATSPVTSRGTGYPSSTTADTSSSVATSAALLGAVAAVVAAALVRRRLA
jgi:hypothetical protein